MAFVSMVQKSAALSALIFSQAQAAPEHEMGISHSLRSKLEEADKYEAVVPSGKSSPKV